MKLILDIRRFQPERSPEPYIERFEVEAAPGTRLIETLVAIQRRVDPTLAFRRSCGHGICGSDALVINGRERLACKLLVEDAATNEGEPVTIEPLRGLPIKRDLIVDQGRFFRTYRAVKPYLIEGDVTKAASDREKLQTPRERERIEEATTCILCLSCFSACPVVREVNPRFLGPAAVVQAFRSEEDSRDRGFEERLSVLDQPDGVWPCENRFECTRVCPRGIKVTKHINLTKKRITDFRASRGEKVRDR
jgi:succinate dehydrogenase / fumarate reductase iron-sulfur subunit